MNNKKQRNKDLPFVGTHVCAICGGYSRPILLPEFNLIKLTMDDVCQHVIDRGREQWVKMRIDDLMEGVEANGRTER